MGFLLSLPYKAVPRLPAWILKASGLKIETLLQRIKIPGSGLRRSTLKPEVVAN